MSKNSVKLRIAYLYPDILKGHCDLSNVETFCQRAKWRDVDVQVNCISANERVNASKYDFYYIGGSNTEQLDEALKSLSNIAEELKIASIASVPILAVNCGYMLFGNYYQLHNKIQVEGIKLLDVETIASKNHHFGNVHGTCEFLKNKTIAGFENHGMVTYLKNAVSPFVYLQRGLGNNGKDKTEGARFNNVIGTYITSALLAQNPHLCDFLIATALRVKYKCRIPLTPLCDDIEWYSHNYILEAK